MPASVAVLGPEGTFSWFTAQEFFGSDTHPRLRPCPDLTAVFEDVCAGRAAAGLVPLENSLHGTVPQSFDLFMNHPLRIQAECYSRITNVLLGAGPLESIRAVYSHPQPLGQCGRWLRAHLPDVPLVAMESTAAAARFAAEHPEKQAAALGHPRLAALTGLRILAQDMEDGPENWTRFALVVPPHPTGTPADPAASPNAATTALWSCLQPKGHGAAQPNGAMQAKDGIDGTQAYGAAQPKGAAQNKDGHAAVAYRSSLLFTLPDQPGALAAVLNVLAGAKINMGKLESRPLAGACWKYVFFVDADCNLAAPEMAKLRHDLAACCTDFSLLGSYPRGPRLLTAPSPQTLAHAEDA